EGSVVGDRDDGEAEPVRLLDERGRHLREAEAESEEEPGEPVALEPAHVRALGRRHVADAEPGREQQLATLEPRRGIRQLGDVEPAHLVRETLRAAHDRKPEIGHRRYVADGQHGARLDALAKEATTIAARSASPRMSSSTRCPIARTAVRLPVHCAGAATGRIIAPVSLREETAAAALLEARRR